MLAARWNELWEMILNNGFSWSPSLYCVFTLSHLSFIMMTVSSQQASINKLGSTVVLGRLNRGRKKTVIHATLTAKSTQQISNQGRFTGEIPQVSLSCSCFWIFTAIKKKNWKWTYDLFWKPLEQKIKIKEQTSEAETVCPRTGIGSLFFQSYLPNCTMYHQAVFFKALCLLLHIFICG